MNIIRISGKAYKRLIEHLYPGDNKEAVAIALCGRAEYNGSHVLLVKEVLHVPYDICIERKGDLVRWPTDVINPFLEKAQKKNYGILKIHCHPGGGEFFSDYDDESDINLFRSIHSYLDDNLPHASCIMLPDKRLFGRFFFSDMHSEIVHKISVAGDDVISWNYGIDYSLEDKLQERNLQAFGRKTMLTLKGMRIGVIGCSGTGSPVIEQLKRLGVGELILVDPDYVDFLNLNRITGSELKDAEQKVLKVDVMKREIEKTGFETKVKTFARSVSDYEVVKELSICDFLFGSVDTAIGRHTLNQISSYYLIQLIDMGVKLEPDGNGGIKDINGVVHFIQPEGSSLLSRGQYTSDQLYAENVRSKNKDGILRNQYLAEVNEFSPAVVSVNMQVASTAVNDFLARLHPYRLKPNHEVGAIYIRFSDVVSYSDSLPETCNAFNKMTGLGDVEPLLNTPNLASIETAS